MEQFSERDFVTAPHCNRFQLNECRLVLVEIRIEFCFSWNAKVLVQSYAIPRTIDMYESHGTLFRTWFANSAPLQSISFEQMSFNVGGKPGLNFVSFEKQWYLFRAMLFHVLLTCTSLMEQFSECEFETAPHCNRFQLNECRLAFGEIRIEFCFSWKAIVLVQSYAIPCTVDMYESHGTVFRTRFWNSAPLQSISVERMSFSVGGNPDWILF